MTIQIPPENLYDEDRDNQGPQGPTTNTELVQEMMEFSRYGALAQIFIIDAITKHANAVAAADIEELGKAMADGPIHAETWKSVALEIQRRMNSFYGRHDHGTPA